MRIAFISASDASNKNTWSGTTYYIYKHLQDQFPDVLLVSPIRERRILLKKVFSFYRKLRTLLTQRQFLTFYSQYILPKEQGQYIDNYLKNKCIDCIISTESSPFLYNDTDIPLIIITDATVKLLYSEYSNGTEWSKQYYKILEENALKVTNKASLIISSSRSTTSSLINDYNILPQKIATIPFGANIDDEEIEQRQRQIDKSKIVNFLFVGRYWERKGGEFAVAICDELLKQNIKVHLDVVGCVVPEKFQRSYINNYFFLDKNNKKDLTKLKELYKEAHFFMVFSKAEMYGIVFCEAAAYGLPAITFAVGGIVDVVINDKTGIILPKETKADDFVSKIYELISIPRKYHGMSNNARKRYEELLNWDVFTKSLKNEIYNRLN